METFDSVFVIKIWKSSSQCSPPPAEESSLLRAATQIGLTIDVTYIKFSIGHTRELHYALETVCRKPISIVVIEFLHRDHESM